MRTLLNDVPNTDRIGRYPKHPFLVNALPFTLQPICIAPVLPNETMNNLFMEARVVSDVVKNPIIGWKKEYHFFYVKITDLLQNAIRDMFIDPTNTDLMATLGVATASQALYHPKGGIDYMARCLQSIAAHWFRDQDEAWNSNVTASGLPIVQIKDTMWMDSLTDKDMMPEGANISTATTAGDLDRLMDAFEALRALNVANMSYEDFLRSYGIAIPEKDENRPEKLASFSDYQYPSNAIDPVTGTPSSAVSWVFRQGERSPKMFKEPGFIIGVSITRPKVYFSGLAGSLAAFMSRAWDWMPAYLNSMPETSLKKFAGDTGPLGDRTVVPDAHWIDMRDLLLYGDQFQNVKAFDVAPAMDGALHLVPLPTGDTFNTKYLTEAQIRAFFKTGGAENIKMDGYVSFAIKGQQVDHTKQNFAIA